MTSKTKIRKEFGFYLAQPPLLSYLLILMGASCYIVICSMEKQAWQGNGRCIQPTAREKLKLSFQKPERS